MDPREVLTRTTDGPDVVLRYTDHDEGIVDVNLPTQREGELPVVVLLHGGFWRSQWDRTHTRPLAQAFAREGFLVLSPEYRRVGGTGEVAGGWPATFEDLTAFMTALPGLLEELRVTAERVTVVGHSAGGQLALWLANENVSLDRVVALAPVADLRAAAKERLDDGAVQDFLGGEPDEMSERYDAVDPMTRLATPPACEVVVIHGTDDDQVPCAHSRRLADRHPYLTLYELNGIEHYGLIDPLSNAWRVVRAEVAGAAVDLG